MPCREPPKKGNRAMPPRSASGLNIGRSPDQGPSPGFIKVTLTTGRSPASHQTAEPWP